MGMGVAGIGPPFVRFSSETRQTKTPPDENPEGFFIAIGDDLTGP
jgi:hypothetical protein